MTGWYTTEGDTEQDRLLLAWPDAPIDNPEVCAMLLEVAREQVIAYAPAPADVETPAPDVREFSVAAGTVKITRVGSIVTYEANTNAGVSGLITGPAWVPARDTTFGLPGNQQIQFSVTAGKFFLLANGNAAESVGSYTTTDPGTEVLGPWDDPASRFVYAQLQQAVNLWNAGRVASDGSVGDAPFSFTPRPLDKTIRQIIRPMDGKPHVL